MKSTPFIFVLLSPFFALSAQSEIQTEQMLLERPTDTISLVTSPDYKKIIAFKRDRTAQIYEDGLKTKQLIIEDENTFKIIKNSYKTCFSNDDQKLFSIQSKRNDTMYGQDYLLNLISVDEKGKIQHVKELKNNIHNSYFRNCDNILSGLNEDFLIEDNSNNYNSAKTFFLTNLNDLTVTKLDLNYNDFGINTSDSDNVRAKLLSNKEVFVAYYQGTSNGSRNYVASIFDFYDLETGKILNSSTFNVRGIGSQRKTMVLAKNETVESVFCAVNVRTFYGVQGRLLNVDFKNHKFELLQQEESEEVDFESIINVDRNILFWKQSPTGNYFISNPKNIY